MVVLALVAATTLIWLRSNVQPRPADVTLQTPTDSTRDSSHRSAPDVIARELVSDAAETEGPDPDRAPWRAVATMGPLDAPVEVVLIANFDQQIESLEKQIRDGLDRVSGNALAQLENELSVAELTLGKVRKEIAVDLIRKHDYVTCRASDALPPPVEGFDQMGHSSVINQGENLQVVFYIPRDDARQRGALEYRNALFWGYWESFVATFNAQPVETRKARIALHRRGQAQQQARSRNVQVHDPLTPEELQEAVLIGPLAIDDATWTLALQHRR